MQQVWVSCALEGAQHKLQNRAKNGAGVYCQAHLGWALVHIKSGRAEVGRALVKIKSGRDEGVGHWYRLKVDVTMRPGHW
jgi:hypothetical protein